MCTSGKQAAPELLTRFVCHCLGSSKRPLCVNIAENRTCSETMMCPWLMSNPSRCIPRPEPQIWHALCAALQGARRRYSKRRMTWKLSRRRLRPPVATAPQRTVQAPATWTTSQMSMMQGQQRQERRKRSGETQGTRRAGASMTRMRSMTHTTLQLGRCACGLARLTAHACTSSRAGRAWSGWSAMVCTRLMCCAKQHASRASSEHTALRARLHTVELHSCATITVRCDFDNSAADRAVCTTDAS